MNIKALENQTERVFMYACKESEIRKLKKFQNALTEDTKDFESDDCRNDNVTDKKNKKHKKK